MERRGAGYFVEMGMHQSGTQDREGGEMEGDCGLSFTYNYVFILWNDMPFSLPI